MVDKERSLGIILISWFEMIIGSIIASFAAFITAMDILMYITKGWGNYKYELNSYRIFAVILIIVFGLVFLAGRLTNKLNPIGRILNIYLCSFYIILFFYVHAVAPVNSIKYLFMPFKVGLLGWSIYYAPMVLAVCFLCFFIDSNVKEQFK